MAGRIHGYLEHTLGRRREAAVAEGVTDVELQKRFIESGDEAAFELLVWRHGAMVLGLCRRAVRDEQLAEDAFQAVFLVLARKAGAIRGGNVAGWLFRVAGRVASRALRNRQLVRMPVELPSEPQPSRAESEELTELLDSEVSRLPERLRRPILLCYLGGRSTEDAARELGCPRGTILSRLATARKKLAERLTRRGITLPAAIPLTGLGLIGGLVSSVVAAAPGFRTGTFSLTSSTTLAEGVIRTMTRGTLVASLGGVLIAATLGSGIALVAAQGPKPQPGPTQPLPATAPNAAAPVVRLETAPPDPAEVQRLLDEKTKKIEQAAAQLQDAIDTTEKRMKSLRAEASQTSGAARTTLQAQQAEYDFERELVLADLRDAANNVRVARRRAVETEIDGGFPDAPKKKLLAAEKELDERRASLKALDERYRPLLSQLREKSELSHVATIELARLEQSVAPQREVLAELRRQLLFLRLQLDGITLPQDGADAKLAALTREVEALRKAVRELQKQK